MSIKSKKGSTIVEASMIFPLVIAGVMAVLYIVIGMYSSLSLQSSVHLALRNESGRLSETVYRDEEGTSFKLEKSRLGLRAIVAAEEIRSYQTSQLFTKKITRLESGRSYVIDEAELVRRVNLAKEVL